MMTFEIDHTSFELLVDDDYVDVDTGLFYEVTISYLKGLGL